MENLNDKSFSELRDLAWKAAQSKAAYNLDEWETKFIHCYISNEVKQMYMDIIDVYDQFLKRQISRDKGIKLIKKVEIEHDSHCYDEMMSFIIAQKNAYTQAGIEYGEVTFECPICKSDAKATRSYTPDNYSHSITIRSYCSGCGIKAMN